MEFIFFILRVPAYFAGLAICIVAAPIDLLVSVVEYLGKNLFIAFFRALGIPFVILFSAYFDRNSWPQYQKTWQEDHDRVQPDWGRPFRRFPELNKWLIKGP